MAANKEATKPGILYDKVEVIISDKFDDQQNECTYDVGYVPFAKPRPFLVNDLSTEM